MKHRVLVIDDEIDICETIRDIASEFAEAVMASQAEEALKLLEQQQFSLIISDINMPGMTGLDLLRHLRNKRFSYPVVFVSATDSDESVAKALEYGAADFISKPFKNDELAELVKRTLAVVAATH